MSHFCLLADPAGYAVSDVDLAADAGMRDYWLKLFEAHFPDVLESARISYGRTVGRQVDLARKQFTEVLANLRTKPDFYGPKLGVLQLCQLREKALRDNGIKDPFRHIKLRENRSAVALYPRVIRHAAGLPYDQRWERLIRGIFAGNIFDLGSSATMGYAKSQLNFDEVIRDIRPRPWKVDDFDALLADLPAAAADGTLWGKAIVFVDNAGADLILGVVPFVRQLAAQGTHIVLAANELPALNDTTVDETILLIEELARADEELATYLQAGLFEVVSTGNDQPLIDLSNVSDELNDAAQDADLVILEGMGRTIESNLNTELVVDQLQVCLLKDPSIAQRVGGDVFDCVCRYKPAIIEEGQAEGEAQP